MSVRGAIKVESPDARARTEGGLAAYKGENGHFLIANRNKRGLTLDLKQECARQILAELGYSAPDIARFRAGRVIYSGSWNWLPPLVGAAHAPLWAARS